MNQKITFSKVIRTFSRQSGEEKLRIAFDLSTFVRNLQEAGKRYAENANKYRPRATA